MKARAQILARAFERAKQQNRGFSLRALAKKLDLSPGFVSRVLNGKADLPFERVPDFVLHLKLDRVSESRLWHSYRDKKMERIAKASPGKSSHEEIMQQYAELPDRQFSLLSKWHHISLLELAGCRGFVAEPDWIAGHLGISPYEADRALQFLQASRLLVRDEAGKWVKASKKIRLPTRESQELIRAYHVQMMQKAAQCMQANPSPEEFARRLVTGISIAANPVHLEKAMQRLHEALYEIADILGAGETTEVYQLGIQLFPVTTKKTK